MLLPGRDTFDPQYRFGFNGKENELDFRGVGQITDYGARVYNARLGKFLSVDPYTRDYPWNTPYAYAENEPISNIDLDGLEKVNSTVNPVAAGVQLYADEKKVQANGILKFLTSKEPYRNLWGYSKDWGRSLLGDRAAIHRVTVATSGAIKETSASLAHGISKPVIFFSTINERSVNENITGLTYYGLNGAELYLQFRLFNGSGESSLPSKIKYEKFEGGATFASFEGKHLGYYEYSTTKGLEFDLNIPKDLQNKGMGSKIFEDAMKSTGADKFTASWVRSSGYETGASVNLNKYNEAIKSGLSETEAAWSTWSGGQAKKYGFKNVSVVPLRDGGIQATFTK